MACIFWLWASCCSICFCSETSGLVVRQPHFQRRRGGGSGGQPLGRLEPARGLDQLAEHLAGRAAAGHSLQRRVGLDDERGERVLALQQRRAERRGRGEGVEHLGGRIGGRGHGIDDLQRRRRQRQRAGRLARQTHEEAARPERRHRGGALGSPEPQRRAPRLAAARGPQRGE
jgi:hypothetical protein